MSDLTVREYDFTPRGGNGIVLEDARVDWIFPNVYIAEDGIVEIDEWRWFAVDRDAMPAWLRCVADEIEERGGGRLSPAGRKAASKDTVARALAGEPFGSPALTHSAQSTCGARP